MGNRFVVFLLAIVAAVAIVTGIFLYRKQEHASAPQAQSEQKPAEASSSPPKPTASPAEAQNAAPTDVPSFDVVRIEPSGEGVIAGRAAPGWTVRLESGGTTVAETKADDEGAWTVVLENPLEAGNQSLTLKAISPDGTKGLTSQTPVRVAVGPSSEPQPEPVVPDETAKREPLPEPPVRIKTVEYQDTGADTGKISLAGVGEANKRVFFFFDDAPLAEVTIGADGNWSIDIDKRLPDGEHTIRADTYDEGIGMASGRASVKLGREPQAPSAEAQAGAPAVAAAEPYDLSKQPQPVYPEAASENAPGEAVASAETPSPAQPMAGAPTEPPSEGQSGPAPEPYDLSAQPQPVYPDESAQGSAPVASAQGSATSAQPQPVYPNGAPADVETPSASGGPAPQPFDLSTQPQPVVPQASEASPNEAAGPEAASNEPAVIAEPAGQQQATRTSPPVVFRSVDYQDTGADKGTVSLSGVGDPGSRVLLYFDNEPLGEVIVGDDGSWKFQADKKVAVGEHSFRADHIDEKTGQVLGQAQIGIVRMEPPKQEVAAAEQKPADAQAGGSASPQADTGGEAPSVPPSKSVQHKRHLPRTYTVRRGDTLWEIAESYYGGGWRYRAIVKENRRTIHNPRLIYPKQKFHIPPRHH